MSRPAKVALTLCLGAAFRFFQTHTMTPQFHKRMRTFFKNFGNFFRFIHLTRKNRHFGRWGNIVIRRTDSVCTYAQIGGNRVLRAALPAQLGTRY